ncbi:MAG: hypothetical protein DKINENOH_03135 [bacterium]|nr:hypothetical protein [bacterium]
MKQNKKAPRILVHSLDQIPKFASEDEEREWWATHDLAPELGEDVTAQEHELIQRLKAKYGYASPREEHEKTV